MTEQKTKIKRLRFRKAPRQIGIWRERDYHLMYGDKRVGVVSHDPHRNTFYFYCDGHNSLGTGDRYASIADAKVACFEFARHEIKAGRIQ